MDITQGAFCLDNESAYQQWRQKKLTNHTHDINALTVSIDDIAAPSQGEIDRLTALISAHNMGLYRFNHPDNIATENKSKVPQLAARLGLKRLDNNLCADKDKLTSVRVIKREGQHQYIPYSNKRLSWHTDGYYNSPDQQINSFILHCEQPAPIGGETLVLDHNIAYILLRDENPDYIRAFMQPNAMTIPANILNGQEIRPAQSGAVFSIKNGRLQMRYSARQRNISWQQDTATLEAVAFLAQLWKDGSPYILRHTLQAHEGIICNNVLHCRTAFEDSTDPLKKRLLYRGRYFDHITPSHQYY